MSIQWIVQRGSRDWSLKSSDGYYGIDVCRPHTAYHIEALWAKPVPLGMGSLEQAKQLCNEHRERNGAPA